VAIAVTGGNIAGMQLVELLGYGRAPPGHLQVAVALENPLLLAVRHEVGGRYARRYTGAALGAVGAIQVLATAPETQLGQLAVGLRVQRLLRVEEQCHRLLVAQAAAGVRLGRIEFQVRQVSHGRSLWNRLPWVA